MKDNRPVNLEISTIALPITAIVSILHRVSGVFLVAGAGVLLWILDASLASQDSFDAVAAILGSVLVKLIVWVVLAALIYHSAAGVRHLFMDMGVGETLEGGKSGARLVLVISVILTLLVGALLW